MDYLLDTNVISDYRKDERANPGVRAFFSDIPAEQIFLPVQVIGEIQAGIAKVSRNRDTIRVHAYMAWLDTLIRDFGDRVIEFDVDSARTWGLLLSGEKKDPHPIDKQIAAIAIMRGMTLVTGDKGLALSKFQGLLVLNPFDDARGGGSSSETAS
ncbi:MAG: type II toxin-antitoxin system VapC family toxin [Massilia sp.]